MLYSFDQSTGAIVVKELASESAIEEPRAPVAELPLEPRTHLDGLQIPANFVLPSLVSVRVDAVRSREMRKRPEHYENMNVRFPPGSPANHEALPAHLKLALIFNQWLPNLFLFSYFVQEEDAPEDIVDDCIWALSLFIRLMEECSEPVLRAAGHVIQNSHHRYATLVNARSKIALHLLSVNRAHEAIPYTKALVDEDCSRGDEVWLNHPTHFALHGETLVLSGTDDNEAAKMLRRAMLGLESVNPGLDGLSLLIRTRDFLARALRKIGADDEAKPHETWLIHWFRKNPHFIPDNKIRHLLPPGPILEGLGGETWLENRKQTFKADQRLAKACRTCGAREPLVTLFRCNNCKYIYYCSKECQKNNWKHHNEMTETQENIERMSLIDSAGAKRNADWKLWCNSNHDATDFGLIHALGLHRNPEPTNPRHKFRVLSCGVFRIKDVLRDVEAIMGLDLGEGQEYLDSLVHEFEDGRLNIPVMDLSFSEGLPVWLGSSGTSIDSIRATPYDPDWRKRFNVGPPPKPMQLASGAQDVEHVF
ncbi:hypothetical protein B0H13DRAFT_1946032 [Mycena leptocephala]|nr:hypothetical protein B0H13DRAFT_1946032 [Mycena leptocephala]